MPARIDHREKRAGTSTNFARKAIGPASIATPFIALALTTAFAILTSCTAPTRPKKTDDPIQNSKQQLDQRDFDGALKTLELAKSENANNLAALDQINLLSATAHLGKAGITIERYFGLAERLSERPLTQEKDVLENLDTIYVLRDETANDPIAKFIVDLQKANRELTWYMEIFARIPEFKEVDRVEVSAALNNLDAIKTLSRGVYLFRSVTRAVFIKHHLTHFLKPILNSKQICTVRVRNLLADLSTLRNLTAQLLTDLSFAVPASSESLIASRNSFVDNMKFIETIDELIAKTDPTLFELSEALSKTQPEKVRGVLRCN